MAKVTSKLQITLPKRLAERHGIKPGDDLQFESAAGVIRMVPANAPSGVLSRAERLRLFDEASARIRQRSEEKPVGPEKQGRGWTRDELYDRGSAD